MKQIQFEMPVVSKCEISHCVYNGKQGCHAKAITIGDSTDPECDTFLSSSVHARAGQRVAGVGACKVSLCRFNADFECTADSIAVGRSGGKIHCLTFTPKED